MSVPSERLDAVLARFPRAAIAVSGGVDSMTLAHMAQRHFGEALEVFHAYSPAVPREARARVETHAALHGWRLSVLDAGEIDDPDYRANPLERCYFCKSNLFARLRAATDATVFTGANVDDLGDFRPGLRAAAEHGVVHPYVEAGLDKAAVREIARALGLADIAELPASPCLASRIETGIRIEPEDLAAIDRIETGLRARLGPVTLRCRLRKTGVSVEIDSEVLDGLSAAERGRLDAEVRARCMEWQRPWLGLAPYERGSAFLGRPAHAR